MKNFIKCTLSIAVLSYTACAYSFDLNSATKAISAVTTPGSKTAQSAELVNQLSGLNVSTEQALGGTSALLALAKNQLPGSDYNQILQSVPALKDVGNNDLLSKASTISGLLGKNSSTTKPAANVTNIQSMADVATQFSTLGMDSGMINQFTPVLLQFIGNQGVSQPLLNTLSTLWAGQPTN